MVALTISNPLLDFTKKIISISFPESIAFDVVVTAYTGKWVIENNRYISVIDQTITKTLITPGPPTPPPGIFFQMSVGGTLTAYNFSNNSVIWSVGTPLYQGPYFVSGFNNIRSTGRFAGATLPTGNGVYVYGENWSYTGSNNIDFVTSVVNYNGTFYGAKNGAVGGTINLDFPVDDIFKQVVGFLKDIPAPALRQKANGTT